MIAPPAWHGRIAGVLAAVLGLWPASAAGAERLVASLSSDTVRITSDFSGVELVLFGAIENDQPGSTPPDTRYDIVATVTGPRENLVTRRKERFFGIWVNAESRSFIDVPSYLAVLATQPLDSIADPDTLRQERIGIANTPLPQYIAPDLFAVVPTDPFRQAFVRIRRQKGLYAENTAAVTFLTPTLYRATIAVPAEAPVGHYEVTVKLFAGGAVISRANAAFDIATVGFESFMATAAVEHGVLYGLATATLAVLMGWLASVLFRRD